MYYYKRTSRELKQRLRDISGSSVSVTDSHTSEKPPESSRTIHPVDVTKENNNNNANRGFTFSNPPRAVPGEELHLPPVQRVSREEKKVKVNSPSSQRRPLERETSGHRRTLDKFDHEEQKRLKVSPLIIAFYPFTRNVLCFIRNFSADADHTLDSVYGKFLNGWQL